MYWNSAKHINYEGIKPQFLTPWWDHSRAFSGGSLGRSAVHRAEAWPSADQWEARPGAVLRVRGWAQPDTRHPCSQHERSSSHLLLLLSKLHPRKIPLFVVIAPKLFETLHPIWATLHPNWATLQRSSIGSMLACCMAGPSSILGLPPLGGFSVFPSEQQAMKKFRDTSENGDGWMYCMGMAKNV